jgi:hypothetical protein
VWARLSLVGIDLIMRHKELVVLLPPSRASGTRHETMRLK